jgi:transcriptional regulator with XRE-family HTH domain
LKTWDDLQKELTCFTDVEKQYIKMVAKMVGQLVLRRQQLGLSQEVVAKKAGLAKSTVGRMETSCNMPRMDTVLKVALALDMKIVLVPIEKHETKDEEQVESISD